MTQYYYSIEVPMEYEIYFLCIFETKTALLFKKKNEPNTKNGNSKTMKINKNMWWLIVWCLVF